MRLVTEDPRTIGQLLKDLRDQMTLLFRQEVALARTEMERKARAVARDSVYVVAGAAVALLAGVMLCFALAFAAASLFAQFMDDEVAIWLGPLVLAIVLGAVAWALIQAGIKKLKRLNLKPEQSISSLREDKRWLQEKI